MTSIKQAIKPIEFEQTAFITGAWEAWDYDGKVITGDLDAPFHLPNGGAGKHVADFMLYRDGAFR